MLKQYQLKSWQQPIGLILHLVRNDSFDMYREGTEKVQNPKEHSCPKIKSSHLEWRFSQCFGERSDSVVNADIISSLEFDDSGTYLATGDRGGRVVIFKDSPTGFNFFAEFQSHEPEFDYLKSVEIEERINKIKWCKQSTSKDLFLLTTNDSTIKLWKLSNRRCSRSFTAAAYEKSLPFHQRSFKSSNFFHINSISPNIDGFTFLSSDDLRVSLWQLEDPKHSLTLVDIKPTQIDELQQVITTSTFHPHCTHQFLFATSKGIVQSETSQSEIAFFGDLLTTISDAKFSPCENYILARDFRNLYLWDIRSAKEPLAEIQIPPNPSSRKQVQSRLLDLYESESLFEDKFECGFDGTSSFIYTGSYNNMNYIFDMHGNLVSSIYSDKSIFDQKTSTPMEPYSLSKKIISSVWNPSNNSLALAAANNLFIFRA